MSILQIEKRENAREIVETVYGLVKNNSGKITSAELDKIVGNKQDVRYAITRLTVSGMIKRVRGFGADGIEYYYHDLQSKEFARFRKNVLYARND